MTPGRRSLPGPKTQPSADAGASVCCSVSLRVDEKRDLGEGRGKALLQVVVTLEGGSSCEDDPVSRSWMGVCLLTFSILLPKDLHERS